jgi:hypothetical protein
VKTIKRRTPWDASQTSAPYPPPTAEAHEKTIQERPTPYRGFFCLHGLYFFDPERSTSADFRQFLWSGLRVLHAEAVARGLPEDEIRRLLVGAFDKFHDAADGLWMTIRDTVFKVPDETRDQPVAAPFRPQPIESQGRQRHLTKSAESPEQAELRRLSLNQEEEEAYNRACHDEDLRELLDD